MQLEFLKDNSGYWSPATFFLAVQILSLPYSIEDGADRIIVDIPDSVGLKRIYVLGLLMNELGGKVVPGVVSAYKKKKHAYGV
jgi:hypothetical protein